MKTKVLLVDDDEALLRLGNLMLKRYGFDVVTARGGCEAVEKARSESPNVIVMDINMPGLDGISTLQVMRSGSRTGRIPVITWSSLPGEVMSREAFVRGAVAYLEKPVDFGVLASEIRMAVESRASSAF